MMWWWQGKEGVKMSEDEFFELLEYSLCSDFVEYLEIVEGKGYYIPFVTTINYLTHTASRSALKLKDLSKLKN